jgi:hypothetical protein
MVLTVYIELSPVIGLVCHRRQQICGFAGPGRADQTSADLTPASRRQDHTTSPSAVTSLVDTHFRSLTGKPALQSHRAQDVAASTASRAYVRDDRETPLMWDGMAVMQPVIWGAWEPEYFCTQGWTGQISLILQRNFCSNVILGSLKNAANRGINGQ